MTDTARLSAALASRYAIERELGKGGMATVYLARDTKLDREVALKVLRPELAAVLGAERFLEEIRISAKLDHPHILTLIEAGESEGFVWYVLPYVRGESLRDKLTREQQLSIDEAVRVATQVAGALDYAHRHGVVHRDIKPENILLHEGEAVVADFGIALAVREAGGPRLTESGLSLGTPQYMSPEHATGGRELDARTDVYSLAAVVYEMLAGEPPHTGPTVQAVIAKLLTERPTRIRTVRDTVPEGIDNAVAKALAKVPADRFRDVAEFAGALAVARAVATPSWPRRRMAVAAGILGALALAATLWLLVRTTGRGGPAPAPNSVAVLYFDNLSRDTADAFLADGLTEELIIRLGQVQRLDVKSRFESQRFRGGAASQDPPVLGRSLGAAYLVTGSVQRAGDRVRLRVALVRAATRAQVWGDVIERASRDLLTVESDIARAVATAVTGQLLPEERSRLARPVTTDPFAYEEYLRGLQSMNASTDEAAQRSALAHFDLAIARDSGLAAAFAGKANVWANLADGYLPGREGYARAREAARQAIARDSSQARAYAMLALSVLALDLDAREAERLARRAVALELRNGHGQAHTVLGEALFAAGRIDESIEEARRGWQADSLFTINGVLYADALIYGRRLDSAAALLPRLRAVLSPVDVDPLEGLLRAAQGDLRGAAPLLSWRYYGGRTAGTYVRALLARGDTVAARATVDSMLAARTPGYYNPLALARAYAALGDISRGMEWLRRAFEERTVRLVYVRVDDELASLRADPHYAALERQLRF